jgi:hypothetical protein
MQRILIHAQQNFVKNFIGCHNIVKTSVSEPELHNYDKAGAGALRRCGFRFCQEGIKHDRNWKITQTAVYSLFKKHTESNWNIASTYV